MNDTAEEFTPLPTENETLDARLTRPQKTFQGKKLFPFSEGISLMFKELTQSVKGDDRWLMHLMFVLLDLQELFDKHRATGKGEDDATDAALEDFLTTMENPKAYQAKTIRRAGKLGKAGAKEAVMLALEIYREAEETELMAAEPDAAPGK